jgi:hypothetical protein
MCLVIYAIGNHKEMLLAADANWHTMCTHNGHIYYIFNMVRNTYTSGYEYNFIMIILAQSHSVRIEMWAVKRYFI